jgi:uncharacterized protein YukE
MAEYNLHELLQLAGVHDSDKKAVAWLEAAIAGANHNYQAAQTRPHARDHNEWLAEIERAAKKLNKTLERLRKRHTAYRGFWHSSAFGPVFSDRFEIKEVRETIDKIIRAANEAKDPRKGRGRQTGKQHVVDLALGFFERFLHTTLAEQLPASFPSLPENFIPLRQAETPKRTVLTGRSDMRWAVRAQRNAL